jgi:hypothetical protein
VADLKAWKAAAAARAAADPTVVPHGTRGGYDNWRCRCEDCKAAKSQANAEARARRLGIPVPDRPVPKGEPLSRAEITARYRERHKETLRQSERERGRRYYAENREAILARAKARRANGGSE